LHKKPELFTILTFLSVYKTHMDPDFMIKFVEQLRPEDCEPFEAIARRIIQPYPNTYTYTKALSEQIVRKYGSNLNVAVIRPSIITTTFHDPLPGYTDNLYGVNGVVTGAGVGVLRILHIDNTLKANIIPADFVVNAILGLAWFTVLKK
jgi:alcohol-forming fatty acyl-CoA reductase